LVQAFLKKWWVESDFKADLSFGTTEYGYKVFHRNFFETSHAKGPQDAAAQIT
jgi:hypothetical protein